MQVRVQQLPWTAAHEKLLTAYAGDALPDLCQLGNTWLPEFSALGALEPLDERMAAAGIPRDDYFAGVLDTNVMPTAAHGCSACRGTSTRACSSIAPTCCAPPVIAAPPETWAEWRAAMQEIRRLAGARQLRDRCCRSTSPIRCSRSSLQQGPVLREDDTRGAFSQPPFRRALDFYAGSFATTWRRG